MARSRAFLSSSAFFDFSSSAFLANILASSARDFARSSDGASFFGGSGGGGDEGIRTPVFSSFCPDTTIIPAITAAERPITLMLANMLPIACSFDALTAWERGRGLLFKAGFIGAIKGILALLGCKCGAKPLDTPKKTTSKINLYI